MLNDIPPSGPWTGYYLYGHAGRKHYMRLGLVFTPDGRIRGEGMDDVAPFVIDGLFNGVTREASWTKAYVRRHTVQYFGIYSQRAICGDWTLGILTGDFWIWPDVVPQSEKVVEQTEFEESAEPVLV